MRTRENYGGLDAFRPLAALFVVAIHTSPLASFSAGADFFLTRVLARVAVPFFFMVTGQFVAGRFFDPSETAAPWRYLRKISFLYLTSILLYLPIGLYAGHYKSLTFGTALKMLLFDGTFYHLWYFPACLMGVLLVFLMSRFLKLRGALAVSAVLYLVGLLGDSYYGLAEKLPLLKGFYDFVFRFSSYTRNGLFFTPLFLVLGAWVQAGATAEAMPGRPPGSHGNEPFDRESKSPQKYQKYQRLKIYLAALCVSFALMTAEAFCLRHFKLQRHDSMYCLLIPVMIFLYKVLLLLPVRPRKLLRNAALWIYVLHPAFIVVVRGMAKVLKLTPILVDNSLVHYLAVAALSTGAGFCIAFFQERISHHRLQTLPASSRKAAKTTARSLPSPTGRAWIELDEDALSSNVALLRSLLPENCRLMPAVKANAYGHGAVLIAKSLNTLGVDAFCVASPAEGISLRKAGVRGKILILGYTAPTDLPLLARYHLAQTVIDYPYAKLLESSGIKLRVHLGIDTGMHRLGIRCEDIEDILSVFGMKNLSIDGMLTHLGACDLASAEGVALTEGQISAFYQVAQIIEEQGFVCPRLHLQSSYGLLNYPGLDVDYVRPGILLYGVHSSAENAAAHREHFYSEKFFPVLSLRARVASVRTLYPGDSAGYGLAFTAEKTMRIAILSIGYADGLPRTLSCGRGSVLINGSKAPIIGRVCMDLTLADVSGIPGVKQGDVATVIGRSGELEITAEQLADQCGIITNELLSRLGARLERFFTRATVS